MTEANLLIQTYLDRRAKNPSYSERAFAKSLGLSPGFLKLFFQGKRHLSAQRAKLVAHRLGWSELQAGHFQAELAKRRGLGATAGKNVDASSFAEISDWYHFAIVELLKTKGTYTPALIASALGLSRTEVDFSLRLLQQQGLVEKKVGRYRAAKIYGVPSASSSAIRKFHRQCFEKAQLAIDEQSPDIRELRSLTLAFDRSRQKEAAAFIKKFVASFERKFEKGNLDSVYQLSMAFYTLTNGEK